MWRKRKKANNPEQGCFDDSPVKVSVVRDKAIYLLAGREHGKLELKQKLTLREYPSDLIDGVLDELQESGLQCDIRFAESYTRMRVNRGYGENKIRADLQAKRLSREIIEAAISESGADWDENAHAMLLKKFGIGDSIEMPADYKKRAARIGKMTRFLQARGYGSPQISEALKRVRTATSNEIP